MSSHWDALHRAIHIRMCCRDKPLRSFLYSLMLDCGTSLTEWKSEVKKIVLIWMCCQYMTSWSTFSEWDDYMNRSISVSHVRAQILFGSKRHSTGLLVKCCKKAGRRKKKKPNRLCVLTAFQVIYTAWKKLCRLHVSAWWELLNYWWMFLITSHKCWNITLLQCLEGEEGGL